MRTTPLETPPLPPSMIEKLADMGISTTEDLRTFGVVRAFLLLKQQCGIHQSILWALIAQSQNRTHYHPNTAEQAAWLQAVRQHPPVAPMPSPEACHQFMGEALALAQESARLGEVPVGAVVVHDNVIVGRGRNECIRHHDVSAHAEINALRDAGRHQNNFRATGCDLYVTLEPCTMCASAIIQARIRRVIYGANEPKSGAAGSVTNLFSIRCLNNHTSVFGGIRAAEARQLLQNFFEQRRNFR